MRVVIQTEEPPEMVTWSSGSVLDPGLQLCAFLCLYGSDSSPNMMGNPIPTYVRGSQSVSPCANRISIIRMLQKGSPKALQPQMMFLPIKFL